MEYSRSACEGHCRDTNSGIKLTHDYKSELCYTVDLETRSELLHLYIKYTFSVSGSHFQIEFGRDSK